MLSVATSVSRVVARVVRNPERFRTLAAAVSVSENFSTTTRSRLISAFAGFQKDVAFGVSNVNINVKGFFGHDASFVARHPTLHAVGVADGVGGWERYGIDPSGFSQQLMETCKKLIESGEFDPQSPALEVLSASYQKILDDDKLFGGSTACIVVLERSSSKLYTANLGDSGFVVYRPSEKKIVAQSTEQTHTFNTPFQLTCVPGRNQGDASSGGFISDTPKQADIANFPVQEGDLILVATDGLFDNMPLDLILNELSRLSHEHPTSNELQEVANSISLEARRLSIDAGFFSPFSEKLMTMDLGYTEAEARGGKVDDITVLLSLVTTKDP